VRCDLCGRRANGETTKGYTYYRCSPSAKNHGHLPWFPGHPRAALAAEGQLVEPLARLLAGRVFGASRKTYLAAITVGPETPPARTWPPAALRSPQRPKTSSKARRT